ncbi:helix-turn-helix domain-containing protein [Aureibacter tunicatorum]|uniref:AraC-like DNA-binding protein n=1 Tax=Aureibacter tunicatorum TaxID=866807 RepID=A0AAE3XSU9_9BACT|nr:AraC family transcriptional regulator [Aureibacter tunicatorum]MDR6241394.1 AraC-like DNA-binding protein [Aureibacter tunicatorum]BDD06761.1 AraC family transcriptional regulator [Aureibacter tunicatorum]
MDKKERNMDSLDTIVQQHNNFIISHETKSNKKIENELYIKKSKLNPIYFNGYQNSFILKYHTIHVVERVANQNVTTSVTADASFFQMHYLLDGEAVLDMNDQEQTLRKDEVFIVDKEDLNINISYINGKRYKEVVIQFDEQFFINNGIPLSMLSSNTPKVSALNEEMSKIVLSIFSNKCVGIVKKIFLVAKVLELIVLQLKQGDADNLDNEHRSSKIVSKLIQIKNKIDQNLSENLSISSLAKSSGINEFALKNEFKNAFGKTIFQYVTEKKMLHAKDRLMYSELSIYEIAEEVGYKNATHFTAAFKKIEGLTPNKFRKQYLEQNLLTST